MTNGQRVDRGRARDDREFSTVASAGEDSSGTVHGDERASFYVGPGYPPVWIRRWDDLVAAAESGTLAETQWVELKAAIPASTSAANLEVARDLASLSVDGGLLVVGVKDPGTKAEHVVGTTDGMEGLKSRLGQIAGSTRIQPPLHVCFVPPIVNPTDSAKDSRSYGRPQSDQPVAADLRWKSG